MPEERQSERDQRLTMQALGVTLLGVLLSIGVTVGAAVVSDWWLRLLVGAATTLGLAAAVWALGTRTGLLTRLAD